MRSHTLTADSACASGNVERYRVPETCAWVSMEAGSGGGTDHVGLYNLAKTRARAGVEGKEDAKRAGEPAAAKVGEDVQWKGGCR